MGIWSILETWANRRDPGACIRADAEALLDIWADTAYDVAANLSWREDAGLLRSSSPGHWARVQEEIGRRLSPTRGTPPKRLPVVAGESAAGAPVEMHSAAYGAAAGMAWRNA